MAERYIPEHRRTQFKAKNTFKPEELRRRREEQQVEIRKAKREENLAKRRGIGTGENRPGASLGAAPDSDDDTAPTESQVRWRSSALHLSCYFCSSLRAANPRQMNYDLWPCSIGFKPAPRGQLELSVRSICHASHPSNYLDGTKRERQITNIVMVSPLYQIQSILCMHRYDSRSKC